MSPHRTPNAMSRHRRDAADAFIREPLDGAVHLRDDLAEELAEEFLATATTGQEQGEEALDRFVAEEIGGPFLTTSAEPDLTDGFEDDTPPSGIPRHLLDADTDEDTDVDPTNPDATSDTSDDSDYEDTPLADSDDDSAADDTAPLNADVDDADNDDADTDDLESPDRQR